MAKTQKSAKAKGDSLEEAVQILENAILRESASYADRTFQFEPQKIIIVDGVRHEIDVYVSVDHGNGYTAIFIFECKNWKKKIGKSEIIEFSEKVKVAPAQKGFFVAKSFTRYARAQAKKDPRIELLRVEELDLTEVPSFIQVMLKSFHILKVISTKVEIKLRLRGARDPVGSFTGPVEFLVDDAPASWDEYSKCRIKEAIEFACLKFESIDVPEGTYLLDFKDLRHSDHRNCLINGVPLACIDVSGTIQVHIARPSILESQFEIANRGRVYSFVSQSPFIQMKSSIPQPMTQIRLGVNERQGWKLTNAFRLFILDPTEPSMLQHQFLQPVAEQNAKGLANALIFAQQEEALERRDALLDELRQLAAARPGDAVVREELAKGLFNTTFYAKQEGALERRDALLDELRQLAAAWPGDAAVREHFANGLCNTINAAKQEGALERLDTLLGDLRRLAAACPGDAAVRERLARGLNTTIAAAEPLERRDALLNEVRRLAEAWPGDNEVRGWFALGLYNSIIAAKREEALERRDALLDELRQLAVDNPGDAAVRESLAQGLGATIDAATQEEALQRRDALLDELRRLVAAYPDQAAVRGYFARVLFSTTNAARQEEALELRHALLDELRQLAAAYPGDAAVREKLAMGLNNTMVAAIQEEALKRRDALLDELRQMASAYPDDAAVREKLAMGLVNTVDDANQKEALERRDLLLEELRQLAAAYPADTKIQNWLQALEKN